MTRQSPRQAGVWRGLCVTYRSHTRLILHQQSLQQLWSRIIPEHGCVPRPDSQGTLTTPDDTLTYIATRTHILACLYRIQPGCVISHSEETALIVRGPRPADNFAQIHNAALADGRLSFKARGILAFLLSRPPGWQTSVERLAKSGIDGERAVKSGLQELEKHGYLKRTRTHNPESGTFIHNQVITDQPELVKDDEEVDTTGAKRTDGAGTGHTEDTTGTLRTSGKPPSINNTEPNNTYPVAGDVVNPPKSGEPATPTSRTSYGDARDGGADKRVGVPTHLTWLLEQHKWLSAAALKTAHREIELQDLPLSLTKYEIRMAELNKKPTPSEWLRWTIEDEQKLRAADREQARTNGTKKPWFAVAGD